VSDKQFPKQILHLLEFKMRFVPSNLVF